jgi:hypothetical protein
MEHSRAEVLQFRMLKLQVELCLLRKLDHIQTGNLALRSSLFLDHKLLNLSVRTNSPSVILTHPSEEQQYPAGQLPTPAPQVWARGFLVRVPAAKGGDRSLTGPVSKFRAWISLKRLRFLRLTLNLLPPMILSGLLRELASSPWALVTGASKSKVKRSIAECMVTIDDSVCVWKAMPNTNINII